MARRACLCWCHAEARGNYNEAAQRQDFPAILIFSRVETVNTPIAVDTDDVLEAAVACDDCRNSHCPALLTRYVTDPEAWREPQNPPPAEAAGDDQDGN